MTAKSQAPSKRKIILFAQGGLGNQLFQFFQALEISKRLNCEIVVDTSIFNQTKIPARRRFELTDLSFLPPFKISNWKIRSHIVRRLSKWRIACHGLGIYNDDGRTSTASKHIKYIYGFFQYSQKIWEQRAEISDYLKLMPSTEEKIQELCHQLNASTSTILHIRLGDYLNLVDFPVISSDFIRKSIETKLHFLNEGRIFVVTDSPDSLARLYGTLIEEHKIELLDSRNLNALETIHLLSRFKFLILSKSSLSWWAGFLGTLNGNQIIAPYTEDIVKRGNFHSHQILDGWICIENITTKPFRLRKT